MTLDARTFGAVATCVRSVEELEVLLRLADSRERYSSAAAIAAESGLPPAAAAAALEALASRNLLDVRITDAVLYKLDPASAEVRACLERTLAAAARNRDDVSRAIVRSSAGQDFADALHTGKRPIDG